MTSSTSPAEDFLGFSSLEALVQEGIRSAKAATRQSRRSTDGDAAKPAAPSALYSSPDNWLPGRGIALIHADSQTLLGNFQELLHISDPDARRLVRCEHPIRVDAQEFVSGTWGWVASKEDLSSSAPATLVQRFDLLLQLAFPECSAEAPVLVHSQGRSILRIELLHPTDFAAEDGNFLRLGPGTNIQPVLSQLTKVELFTLVCQGVTL